MQFYLQILTYFFYNIFIFSHWPLIFYIIKFNTSLYRFLLKNFNFESNYSIPFLVSYEIVNIKYFFVSSNDYLHLYAIILYAYLNCRAFFPLAASNFDLFNRRRAFMNHPTRPSQRLTLLLRDLILPLEATLPLLRCFYFAELLPIF